MQPAAATAKAKVVQAVDDEQPTEIEAPLLHLKLGFLPGTLLVERKGKVFVAARKQRLHLGDVLSTRGGRQAVLGFPADQWLVLSGRLRLAERVDARGGPVQVELLGGEVRAKGTRRGHGLTVRASQRECSTEEGEFRVRVGTDGLRVQSLTAVVRIRGPHAERVVPRASELRLATRPGFSHPLLPGAERLRPIQHSGTRPPSLSWDRVHGATAYRVLIAAEPNFWVPEETAVVREPRYRPYTDRPGRHFWQVIALQADAEGYPSKVFAYLIEEP